MSKNKFYEKQSFWSGILIAVFSGIVVLGIEHVVFSPKPLVQIHNNPVNNQIIADTIVINDSRRYVSGTVTINTKENDMLNKLNIINGNEYVSFSQILTDKSAIIAYGLPGGAQLTIQTASEDTVTPTLKPNKLPWLHKYLSFGLE